MKSKAGVVTDGLRSLHIARSGHRGGAARRARWLPVLAATAAVLLDVVSKLWVHAHLSAAVATHADLQFAIVTNRGAAWSLGSTSPSWVLGAELAGTVAVAWWMSTRTTIAERMAVAAALGGAVANLIDRLGRGSVTDWIRVAPYPAYFNVADVAVRGGLIAAVILAFTRRRSGAHSAMSTASLPTADRIIR